MAIPKTVSWVTLDVYGTLIDWESGVMEAFEKAGAEEAFEFDKNVIIPPFKEIQHKIEAGSYELYAEVLRRTAVEIAEQIGWRLESSQAGFLPGSIPKWKPFSEANPALNKLAKKFQTGLVSNIDDKLLGQTRRHIPLEFDLVVTAQQVRAYKPDPAHFKEFARRIGGKKGWVHITSSYFTDVEPLLKMKVPVIWINRNKEVLEKGQKKPDAEVKNLREALKLLGAA
jgi:2-haloacid dehalogenase/putative hydrolase of the HAD superfamily